MQSGAMEDRKRRRKIEHREEEEEGRKSQRKTESQRLRRCMTNAREARAAVVAVVVRWGKINERAHTLLLLSPSVWRCGGVG